MRLPRAGRTMYSLKDGDLYWNTRLLGPSTNIYVDATQDCSYQPALTRVHLEVADYVMVTPGQKIVTVEEKRLGDLISSYGRRRVQRQLRDCARAGDIFILAIRFSEFISTAGLFDEYPRLDPLHVGLLKLQMLGGFVGFLPPESDRVPGVLKDWRAVLTPSQSTLSILAGDDRPATAKKRYSSLTSCGAALARLLPGCGPVTAAAWAARANEDIREALAMNDQELKEAGLHKGLIRKLNEIWGVDHAG